MKLERYPIGVRKEPEIRRSSRYMQNSTLSNSIVKFLLCRMTKAFIESEEKELIASFLNVKDDAKGLKVLSSNMKLLVFRKLL